MSRHMHRILYTVAALAGLAVCGVGLSGVAAAAPAPPSPASSAPASADPAPAVPRLLQPLDASDGLLGMQRGSLHSASTPDMSQIPLARQLPMIDITPLPKKSSAADDDSADSESADDAAAGNGTASAGTSAVEDPSSDSAAVGQ